MLIQPKGSPSQRVWVILDQPLSTDSAKGYVLSGGMGFLFDRMMQDAGIKDYYTMALRPDPDVPSYAPDWTPWFDRFKPPFIIFVGASGSRFLSELKPRITKNKKTGADKVESYKTALNKYVGSLLQCASFNFAHYAMPLLDLNTFASDWAERQIATYFDLQKMREEYAFWKKHSILQSLPYRQLVFRDLDIQSLLGYINRFRQAPLISVDIETCYPKSDSEFYPHPGYPLTIGIADSPTFGISFNLFREDKNETKILWRALRDLLYMVPSLGQNFFNFDTHFIEMLGFEIKKFQIKDTLIRHHVLWPELPHKLQFQTRQYTREVFYKDEGHRWSLKNMDALRRYNALDVTVTYEIYLEQEKEFLLRKEIA